MEGSIQAVALDKDGVIFNSEAQYQKALRMAIKETGIFIPESTITAFCGLSSGKTYALLKEVIGNQYDPQKFIHQHWQRIRSELQQEEGLPFIDGAESLIESIYAQGFPLALVTSDSLDGLLYDVNLMRPDLLKYFQVVITLDDVINSKPDPEPYLRAAALLGVEAEKMLVVEDSDYGATAAIRAGTQVLLLPGDREIAPFVAGNVTKTISSHREVLEYLK